MERLRAIFDKVVGQFRAERRQRSGREPPTGRSYECIHCGITVADKPERCPECRAGRLIPTGPTYKTKPGIACQSCGATVDHRYERCPECGGRRFEGIA